MKLSHLKKSIGPLIIGVALAWMASAPWLSAHRLISVSLELSAYWWSFLALLIGVRIFNRLGENTGNKRAIRWVISTIVIICGFDAWIESDSWFTRWKLASISDPEWRQMSADLEKLANDKSRKSQESIGEWHLAFAEWPASLQVLSAEEELGSFYYYQAPDAGTDTAAFVLRGQLRRRCWGIYVGPEQGGGILRSVRKTRIPVATNAYFFVGLDPG